jgi:ribosomal protein L24E
MEIILLDFPVRCTRFNRIKSNSSAGEGDGELYPFMNLYIFFFISTKAKRLIERRKNSNTVKRPGRDPRTETCRDPKLG